MDPKTVHVIGHSLGAQMSGWVGERVPGLGRITGSLSLNTVTKLEFVKEFLTLNVLSAAILFEHFV